MIQIKHKFTGEVLYATDAPRLAGLDLARMTLIVADLAEMNLGGTNFEHANLAVADLAGAELSGANLTAANLTGANLERANLTRSKLCGANLTGANLSAAQLRGADLSGADLQGANLTGASLQDCLLQGAKLARASLEHAVMTGARYDASTEYPALFVSPKEHGAVYVQAEPAGIESFRKLDASSWVPAGRYRPVQTSVEQGVLILTIMASQVEGESAAEALREELLAAIEKFQALEVVVDFQHVKFISSVAFRPLLSLRRKMKEAGGRLVLCGLSKTVGDIFYTTRLVSRAGQVSAPFEMQPDVPAAVAFLNGMNPGKA